MTGKNTYIRNLLGLNKMPRNRNGKINPAKVESQVKTKISKLEARNNLSPNIIRRLVVNANIITNESQRQREKRNHNTYIRQRYGSQNAGHKLAANIAKSIQKGARLSVRKQLFV